MRMWMGTSSRPPPGPPIPNGCESSWTCWAPRSRHRDVQPVAIGSLLLTHCQDEVSDCVPVFQPLAMTRQGYQRCLVVLGKEERGCGRSRGSNKPNEEDRAHCSRQ